MAPSAKKVRAAVDAMEKLGVHAATTKSVLNKLLKKGKRRWKPIEENNYQYLADSIFEMQEEKEKKEKERRDAVSISALVPQMKPKRGRRRRGTEVAASSYLAPDSAIKISNQSMDEDWVLVAALCPPKLLTAGRAEQASKVGCSRADLCTQESSASGTIQRQYERRRHGEVMSFASCINRTSYELVNVGDECCKDLKIVSFPIKEVKVALDSVRKVDLEDITNGNERLSIRVADRVDSNIPYFHYISENMIYKDARVKISLAQIGDDSCCQGCYGDCMNALTPCACGWKTGMECAYTSEGLLREDFLDSCISRKLYPQFHLYFCKRCPVERVKNEISPSSCKGHLKRKFIKECWCKCGCGFYCGNRVLQRKLYPNMEVFYSKTKGWGVRTLEELRRGEFVCEYVGEVLTNKEHYDRMMSATGNEIQIYQLDAGWASYDSLRDEEALCLDATAYGNVARFFNHRCYDANLVDIPIEIETPERHYYHVAFFTTRNIKEMEELNWDYGIDFDDQTLPTKAFKCHCRSRYCRGKNTGKANDSGKYRAIGGSC